jgi:hypothetical protein
MSIIAEIDTTVETSLEAAFAAFTDYRNWAKWMPRSFRPMRGPSRSLRERDRLIVRVAGLPSLITVEQVLAPREVAWTGGAPGVLRARHTFFFEGAGDATRIRSVEEWTGVVTRVGPIARQLKRSAEKIALAQLEGFRRWTRSRDAAA